MNPNQRPNNPTSPALRPVCVITGGGSGIGKATARAMAEHRIILAGRTQSKLSTTAAELRAEGLDVLILMCDVADARSVDGLARIAAELGPVTTVVHAAGMSPHMGDAEELLRVNALGTAHVHQAFAPVLQPGGCLIDVSSVAAHLVPSMVLPRRLYPLATTAPDEFINRVTRLLALLSPSHRAGLAYAISKDYVIWLARTNAARFGKLGLRVLSVSPGYVDTPMGAAEAESTSSYLSDAPIARFGRPEELAALIAFCAGPEAGYLTGTDILCDGGVVSTSPSVLSALRRPTNTQEPKTRPLAPALAA